MHGIIINIVFFSKDISNSVNKVNRIERTEGTRSYKNIYVIYMYDIINYDCRKMPYACYEHTISIPIVGNSA